MALSTYEDILAEVTGELEELKNSPYPEDRLTEWADGFVPIYTSEIVKEWFDLPISARDEWQEYGAMPDKGITDLMAIDLYMYYQALFSQAYAELTEQETN
jgi:hypothetical protein